MNCVQCDSENVAKTNKFTLLIQHWRCEDCGCIWREPGNFGMGTKIWKEGKGWIIPRINTMNHDFCHGCGKEQRIDISATDTDVLECLDCGFKTKINAWTGYIGYQSPYGKNGWGYFNTQAGYLLIINEIEQIP
jgi:predicted RNA-binding Zn-ribbon protein involved in translation (DUF1610 family)